MMRSWLLVLVVFGVARDLPAQANCGNADELLSQCPNLVSSPFQIASDVFLATQALAEGFALPSP